MEQAADRLKVLSRIEEYERKGWFDRDVEDDPPTRPLRPGEVDYIGEKLSTRLATKEANIAARKFIDDRIKDGTLIIKDVIGIENYLLSTMSSKLPADTSLEEACRAVIEERARIMADPTGCKPYTGLTSDINSTVRKAVDITWGKVE